MELHVQDVTGAGEGQCAAVAVDRGARDLYRDRIDGQCSRQVDRGAPWTYAGTGSASEAKRVDGGGERQSDEPGRASILVAAESGMISDLAVCSVRL